MEKPNLKQRLSVFLLRFLLAPVELKIFAFFSSTLFFLDIIINIFELKELDELIIPITGWLISFPYMMGLFFAFYILIIRDKKQRTNARNAIVFMMALSVLAGFRDMLTFDGNNTGNPYLDRSIWRPVWQIAIPALWILLLLFSPRIKKYCKVENPTT